MGEIGEGEREKIRKEIFAIIRDQLQVEAEEISEEKVLESQESALDYKTKGMEKKYQSLTNMHISNILYSDEKRKRVFGLFILFIYICASRVLNLFLNKIYLIIKHFKRFICLSLKKGEK